MEEDSGHALKGEVGSTGLLSVNYTLSRTRVYTRWLGSHNRYVLLLVVRWNGCCSHGSPIEPRETSTAMRVYAVRAVALRFDEGQGSS